MPPFFEFFLFFSFLYVPTHWPSMAAAALALYVLANGRRFPWLFAGLGGFLLGQLLGATVLSDWTVVPVFGLSASLGVALSALALVAERPVVILAAFLGVGFLAFTVCRIAGVSGPWDMMAFVCAGTLAVAAFFNSFERALAISSVLSAAGAIAATVPVWFQFVQLWGGWPALVVAAIATVVGLVHQSRELPASASAPMTKGVVSGAG
ncbi:MAG TPA: hypothetical protein PKD53_07160 [Chloroflexaceae bacterium]|nr:hypothetical protein [Chloroflexaceae bacterium]